MSSKTFSRPVVRFNRQRMAEDMATRGWSRAEFARQAGVADMTVYRFLDGVHQTEPTAKKLADALGYSVRRYLMGHDADSFVADGQEALPLTGKATA